MESTTNKYDMIVNGLNISNPIMIRINRTILANAKGRIIADINSSKSVSWSHFGFRNEDKDAKVYALTSGNIEIGDMQRTNAPTAFEVTINLSQKGWISYTSSFSNFNASDTNLWRYYTGGGMALVGLSDYATLTDIMLGVVGGYIKGTFNVEIWSKAPTKTISESPKTASVSLNSVNENDYEKIV